MTAAVAVACLPGCGSPHLGTVGNGLARVWAPSAWTPLISLQCSACVQLWVAASFSGLKPGAPLDTVYSAEDLGHCLQW